MPYRIAGIDVHTRMLAVVVTDVEVDSDPARQGEPLLEGINLPALGYRVKEQVFTEAAMHLVVGR
jgi:hypothetical protein